MAITFKSASGGGKAPKRVEMGKIPPSMKKKLDIKTGPRVATGKAPTSNDMDAILNEAGLPKGEHEVRGEPAPGTTRFRATKEAVEYRRKQILRLVLRGVPKETIAEYLGMTLRQVYEDMVMINKDMRHELQAMDYVGYIGMSMAFFDECRTIALRLATDNNEKSNGVKMNALRAAMDAESRKHEFLTRVGLFKVVAPTDPFNQIQTGRHGSYSDENDVQSFLQLIAQSAKNEVIDMEPAGGDADV